MHMEVSEMRVEQELEACLKAARRVQFETFLGKDNLVELPPHHAEASSAFGHKFALAHFVFQGGGVLGISHLGFLRAMEHVGIRAVGLAGTSAGAILALLAVAARGRDAAQPIAEALTPILWRMPASSFIDGPYASRRLIKHVLSHGAGTSLIEMSMPLLASMRRLVRTFGLNQGVAFEEWLKRVLLKSFGVESMQDIEECLREVAKDNDLHASPSDLLRIFATALPISHSNAVPIAVKLMFPRQLDVISSRPESLSPARMVRASMSVPLFFDPMVCDLQADPWRNAVNHWFGSVMLKSTSDALCKCRTIAFVDGGMLSNFPIDAFSNTAAPPSLTPAVLHGRRSIKSIATIGVTLASSGRIKESVPRSGPRAIAHYTGALVDGMRHMRDREATVLAGNMDPTTKYSDIRIAVVDVGDHNWLNFKLSDHERSDLFLRGVRGAREFLQNLN
jgi:NTE family protein